MTAQERQLEFIRVQQQLLLLEMEELEIKVNDDDIYITSQLNAIIAANVIFKVLERNNFLAYIDVIDDKITIVAWK